MKKEFGIGEYTTRDGSKAVVNHISTKATLYPLLGYIETFDGVAYPLSWTLAGRRCSGSESDYDLVRQPATVWMNEFSFGFAGNYLSEEVAIEAASGAIRTGVEFREVIK